MHPETKMNWLSIYAFLFFFFIFKKCQTDSHSCGYPPSLWCSSLEIAVECGVQKQCMELNATRPVPSSPPVEVSVYYESFCPGCRTFLTGQLFPTWTMLGDIMRVHLVPYGNAKELPEQNLFSCQHGKLECQANMIEACILNVTGHAAFPVIYCMESSSDVINAAQPCLQLYAPSVEWGTVESCMRGSLGHRLMHENALKTQALRPQHTHVPWVTFNGLYRDDWEDKAMSTLFNLICKLYKGIKPPTCTGAPTKLDQSFCYSFF
ncbi:gamma-interferon-inducible lysosomal thiol reductase [Ictalurus furcatus]|uniref:gamma-interferon-inducible lysosomal thiol reductase n=1 Tax=Ictalurus furcatus TaxID=66913 RepID=UPI002350AC54|nr:gamma-interferon-inducible lysosomal thiol reductase [Ictalurus furcatus]